MAYTITQLEDASTESINDSFIGQLTNGYFVYRNADGSLMVRHVSAPNVTVSMTEHPNYYDIYDRVSHNNVSGDLYALDDQGNIDSLLHITESAGVISVTDVGYCAREPAGLPLPYRLRVNDAGTQVMVVQGGGTVVRVHSTTTPDSGYLTVTATGHSGSWAGLPAENRLLYVCDTHEAIELWNASTGTLIASDASVGYIGHGAGFLSLPNNRMFGVWSWNGSYAAPQVKGIGVLNVSGDVISWDWGPDQFTTDWTGSGAEPGLTATTSLGFFAPIDATAGTSSVYIVNLSNGEMSASPPSDWLSSGGLDDYVDFAMTSDTIVAPYSASRWLAVWSYTAGPTFAAQPGNIKAFFR
jgi:hypothetical protein